ncbi:hypothetical protein [Mesorhizobium sp. 1B3]|uniref:hypothetical protein n=1 Tax=Mesorhizobium sp. 1B3 TaxID=3243599 RepID=UPI003D95327D
MSTKLPPVPPQNRSPKGSGEQKQANPDDLHHGTQGAPDPDRQGQQANTKVNTTHQGHQQDR